jgi:hypothetical protein
VPAGERQGDQGMRRGAELSAHERQMQDTCRHESDHACGLYRLLGPEAMGRVTVEPTKTHLGLTKLGDLNPARSGALNAADLAVVLLLPLHDDRMLDRSGRGCQEDFKVASTTCAEVAYSRRPDPRSTDDPDEWAEDWINKMAERAKRMLTHDEVFLAYRLALEWDLRREINMEPERVVAALERVDEKRRLRFR